MEEPKPRVGYLYRTTQELEVIFDVITQKKTNDKTLSCYRKVIIPKGEILEMRYWSGAHLRDIYNNYFEVDDSQLDRLEEVAEIYSGVRSNNIADLYDILRIHLYTSIIPNVYTFPIIPEGLQEHFKNVSR